MNPIFYLLTRIIRYKAVSSFNYSSVFFLFSSPILLLIGILGFLNGEKEEIGYFGLIFFGFLSLSALFVGLDMRRQNKSSKKYTNNKNVIKQYEIIFCPKCKTRIETESVEFTVMYLNCPKCNSKLS